MVARLLCLLLCLCGLSACGTRPVVVQSHDHLYADAQFQPLPQPIDPAEVMALSPAMREYLQRELSPTMQRREPQRALLDALYANDQLRLRYDTQMTRNASEAFDARLGNCMSLVIMTAAFARELGLQVRYQSVYTDQNWGRRGDLYFTIGHINLSIGRPLTQVRAAGQTADWLTIDFLPQRALRQQRYEVLEEATVVAMFMNNKAAEALGAGRTDEAYWWTRAAIAQDPQLLIAYNTLGVVYQRRGLAERAEQVLRFALGLEPDNVHVLGNLAQMLSGQGRGGEAQPLREKLARLQPEPPFKYFNLGRAAMEQGDWAKAKTLFARELERDPDYHEFHFWLALANLKLGDFAEAQRHLVAARQNSSSREEEALYTAKLVRLQQVVH